ncbi:hypothetical protein CXB51_035160 [Gossypium anomalum]|uniref:Uncharacterized protein n=1 Tax=Gossypium anomalum TaxID=47600 RepID=A0A8J6CHY2_9ROSI|nr:hypothetical protein CXB51_035160 [Gossypium anomalum]
MEENMGSKGTFDGGIVVPGKVNSPLVNRIIKVADLIEEHSRTWKEDMVLSMFDYQEASKILSIQLVHALRAPVSTLYEVGIESCSEDFPGLRRIVIVLSTKRP